MGERPGRADPPRGALALDREHDSDSFGYGAAFIAFLTLAGAALVVLGAISSRRPDPNRPLNRSAAHRTSAHR